MKTVLITTETNCHLFLPTGYALKRMNLPATQENNTQVQTNVQREGYAPITSSGSVLNMLGGVVLILVVALSVDSATTPTESQTTSRVWPCPFFWIPDRTTGNTWCYLYVTDVMDVTFFKALHYCETAITGGSALLTIEDTVENDDVGSQIQGIPVWLGLVRRQDRWVWYDGRTPDFFGWGDDEPSNATERQCATIHFDEGQPSHSWAWRTVECTSTQAIICKIPKP